MYTQNIFITNNEEFLTRFGRSIDKVNGSIYFMRREKKYANGILGEKWKEFFDCFLSKRIEKIETLKLIRDDVILDSTYFGCS